mgnify:CR=1 FL=1
MRTMPYLSIALSLALGLAAISERVRAADDDGFVSLFDGKTLSGWKQLVGQALYRVEDVAVVGTTVPKTPNSFLCTDRDYGTFILEVACTFDPAMTSAAQSPRQSPHT